MVMSIQIMIMSTWIMRIASRLQVFGSWSRVCRSWSQVIGSWDWNHDHEYSDLETGITITNIHTMITSNLILKLASQSRVLRSWSRVIGSWDGITITSICIVALASLASLIPVQMQMPIQYRKLFGATYRIDQCSITNTCNCVWYNCLWEIMPCFRESFWARLCRRCIEQSKNSWVQTNAAFKCKHGSLMWSSFQM